MKPDLHTTGRALLLLLATVILPLATATAADHGKPVVIPLHTYADTPLKTVQVKAGTKTLPFLFDTGGGLTVITPDVTSVLGCEPFGQVTGFRADGEKISLPRCGPVTLRLGDYAARGEVGVFDLMGLIRGQVEQARKQGHDVPMPPTLGGLVGLASFKNRAVTLDYAHGRIIVETPASLRKRIASMQPIRVRVVTEASGSMAVFAQARARTGTLWMELDSGNNGPTFLAPHAVTQLGIKLPEGKTKSMQLALTGFGKVPVKVSRRTMIYDGQLGIGMIDDYVWTIDLEHGKAWIKPADQESRTHE